MPRAWPGSRTGPGPPEWADVGDLGRDPGHGLGPGLARGPHNGLDCTPVGAGARFYQEPGIQDLFQGGADLVLLGPTINLTTA